ncbi:hypothetical protein SK128_015409 [Halocaridina rubra]|uniref:Uncharacterized protein n=1 Tax=Halocaridina rubra TaxID=373956 RepID=A0AAN8WC46_HALRR
MTVETTSYGYVTLVTIDSSSDSEVSRVKVDLCLPKQCHRVSKPRFITYHRDGRLLVVDLGLHCIYVVDINQGTLVSVFGEEGVKEGQLRDPSGILSDSEGYIVVGDSRNHRIQIILEISFIDLRPSATVGPLSIRYLPTYPVEKP